MLDREIVTLGQIVVGGVSVVTTNKQEAGTEGVIISLHEYFIQSELSSLLVGKKDDRMISLYTDYQSDESGEYTYAIGHEMLDLSESPSEIEIFEIPAGQYLRISTERGFMNDVLPEAWRRIWEMNLEDSLGVRRSFTHDFEFHNYDDLTSADVQIDIYLSIIPSSQ